MKIKKVDLLQLLLFLDRRPQKDFPDVKSLRKITGAAEEIRSLLGDFYDEIFRLEMLAVKLVSPYQQEARELMTKEYADLFLTNSQGNLELRPDPSLTPEDLGRKDEYQKKLDAINEKLQKDKEIKKSSDELAAYRKEHNDTEVDLEFKNREYLSSVKEVFEKHGLEYEWGSKKVFSALYDSLEI